MRTVYSIEQRNKEDNIRNTDWVTQNMVSSAYAYFPHYEGLFDDGINAIDPNQQPGEYYDSL